jgi:hypothetical protein
MVHLRSIAFATTLGDRRPWLRYGKFSLHVRTIRAQAMFRLAALKDDQAREREVPLLIPSIVWYMQIILDFLDSDIAAQFATGSCSVMNAKSEATLPSQLQILRK